VIFGSGVTIALLWCSKEPCRLIDGSAEQNAACCRWFSMDRKKLVARALAKAEKYRSFTRWIGDQETVQRILELSAKLKRRARAIARPTENRLRRRARELWEESGRPSGRDLEFWLQAEREFHDAEDLAKRNGPQPGEG
jgi:hypothetical protein